jgi:hypothetical protein
MHCPRVLSHSGRYAFLTSADSKNCSNILYHSYTLLSLPPQSILKSVSPQLSFIFKCLCDTVILDDFKTALDQMRAYWLRKQASGEILLTNANTARSPRRGAQQVEDIESGSGGHRMVRNNTSFSMPRAVLKDEV